MVRRKVVRAKRPGGMSKNDGKEDGNEAKTPNAFASLVSGGVKKAVDESKKEESPQKGSVFSRLSKKGGGEEDKSLTTTKKESFFSFARNRRNKLTRQQQQQQQQQQHQKSENKDQPSLALFPGLANFKDDENKKPPPKGGAGVFSGFAGFAPKPSTSNNNTARRRRTVVVDFRRRRRKFETVIFKTTFVVQTVRVRQRARHRDQPFEREGNGATAAKTLSLPKNCSEKKRRKEKRKELVKFN